MPAMANITIKKADGVTDVTFTAAAPSAGDSVPAIWRQNSASTIMGHRPRLSLLVRDNAAKNGRVFQGAVTFPITFTELSTGKVSLVATVPVRFEGTLPSGVSSVDLKEAIYQASNLFASTLVRGALEEQYAPT